MMRRSPMKPGVGLKRTAFARSERIEAREVSKLHRAAPAKKAKAKPPQRGRTTNAEREHMGRVAALGCCLCAHLNYGHTAAEVHHVRARHGWGRSGHLNTIPLCPLHHRGQPGGVHDFGREQFAAYYGVSELELLAIVVEKLGVA